MLAQSRSGPTPSATLARVNHAHAREVAIEWVRAHGDAQREVEGLCNPLANELASLVPDEATLGVGRIDDSPVVLAAAGSSLLVLSARQVDEQIEVRCERIPLTAEIRINLTETLRQEVGRGVRQRAWIFTAPNRDPFTLVTSELLYGGFSDERRPSSSELVARAVAAKVGWTLSEPDPRLAPE